MIRQGDVLFIPVPAVPETTPEKPAKLRETGIIQEGEVTGHHHKLAVLDDAEVLEIPSNSWQEPAPKLYVKVGENGVSIVHEEHSTVKLAPNTTYHVHIAREFDYFQNLVRAVRD